jgi:pantothenate kinase-related protein Tda10
MAQLQLKKAQRSKAFLKLGLSGSSGSGKTYGALLMAYGLMKELHPEMNDAELWNLIAIIDTENGSGELYVG